MIDGSSLVVQVNSDKRSKRIQKEITKRLGERAVLIRTETESHEGLMKKATERIEEGKPEKETDHQRLMRESPEARALLKGMMDKHWSTWPDIPLPALKGMTPRDFRASVRMRGATEATPSGR